VVALGTSAPEIFVGISSILNQSEPLAMGAVVGSNISNIALIFGVSCIGIATKSKKTPLIQFIPFLLSALILGYALKDLLITPFESILLLIVFTFFLYVIFKNKASDELVLTTSMPKDNSIYISVMLIAGLVALIVGSNFAVIYAEKIAILLKISELVIGLTIIAIGTSLPELAATISAVIKKKTDMVVGNVIGSNVLNITLVVPIIGLFSNVQLDQILFNRDYCIMIIATILFMLVGITYSSKKVPTSLVRSIGVIFVIGYVAYILNLSNLI
jgi:cation:H+ antiporter